MVQLAADGRLIGDTVATVSALVSATTLEALLVRLDSTRPAEHRRRNGAQSLLATSPLPAKEVAMALPGFNPSGQGGVVQSSAFNLTKVAGSIAAALSVLIGVNGATAGKSGSMIDWTGFSQGQRTVVLIAIIAAVAIVYAADLLARAMATSSAAAAGVTVMGKTRTANLLNLTATGADTEGVVLAVRASDNAVLFFDPKAQTTQWTADGQLVFEKQAG